MCFPLQLKGITYDGMILKPLLIVLFNDVDNSSNDELCTNTH